MQIVVALQAVRQRHAGLLDVARQLADGGGGQCAPKRSEHRFEHPTAERRRNLLVPLEEELLRIARITREELVAAVAR